MTTKNRQPNAAGALDQRFGAGKTGKIIFDFADALTSTAYSVALQTDLKIVVAGNAGGKFAIVRLTTEGFLDDSFGSGGFVTGEFQQGFNASGSAVSSLPDNKIILVGSHFVGSSESHVAVAKFLTNGDLDTTFGDRGRVILPAPLKAESSMPAAPPPRLAWASERSAAAGSASIHKLPGGKILVHSQHGYPTYGVIARLNENGALDTSFGGRGYIVVAHPDFDNTYTNALQVDADNAIIAGGNIIVQGKTRCVLARYDADGKIDTAYGQNGYAVFGRSNENQQLEHLVGYGDGKVLAIGAFREEGADFSASQCMLWGRDSDGGPDKGFNKGLITLAPVAESGAIWSTGGVSNNKVTVAGFSYGAEESDTFVGRYHLTDIDGENSGGSLDSSFGGGVGWVRTKTGPNADVVSGLVLQPDGKIVVCGTSISTTGLKAFVVRCLG